MQRALITGITGQDGFFLAEYLLSKGYHVMGVARHPARVEESFAHQLEGRVEMLFGDVSHEADVMRLMKYALPDEVYHLASQSRPGESWLHASTTLKMNGLGALYVFDAVRLHCPKARVFHASSSELFGQCVSSPQNEVTPFNPSNPYGASKVYAHHMARLYRENYGLFIACGILFNHESELRPLHFVTQKVAYGAACAALGVLHSPDTNERGQPIVCDGKLSLGNLHVARDWSHARDVVRAMWLMLQQESPDDFVIGSGQLHTLQQLCEVAYGYVGCEWQAHVVSDPALVRPLETTTLVSYPTKAEQILGWNRLVGFEQMVRDMVDAQMTRLSAFLNG